MKLHFAPGASSLSCHIALEESRLAYQTGRCEFEDDSTWSTVEKLSVQGAIPVLELDDGKVLTQSLAILLHVAEKAPQAALLPAAGTFERAQAYQWLFWAATDLGKAISPLFFDSTSKEKREEATQEVNTLLKQVDTYLANRQYLAGNAFSIADAHLFAVYGWTKWVKLPTENFRNLNAYCGRLFERPAFQKVMKAEGLA